MTAILVGGLLGLGGAVLALWQRGVVASLRGAVDGTRVRAEAAEARCRVLEAESASRLARWTAAEHRHRAEVAAMMDDLAKCTDPAVVRARLQRLLGGGG